MKVSISYLHHQSADWLRELEFYREEIAVLTRRLEEVTVRNTSTEVRAQVEQFQNKFILQREEVDRLTHAVKEQEHRAEALAKERPEHINEKFVTANDELHQQMKDLSRAVADLRFAFNGFLSRVM